MQIYWKVEMVINELISHAPNEPMTWGSYYNHE